MICFIKSGFLFQSAVYKKFAARTNICGDLALIAKVITLSTAPKSIKHFIALILSPNLMKYYEAKAKFPWSLQCSAI